MPTSVIIADDHDVLREGIKSLLGKDSEYTIVAEAGNGQKALELVEKHKPDILLLDISMPQRAGLDIIRQVHHVSKDTKVVVVTMHRAPVYLQKALKLGIAGYLHKENVVDDLLPALKRIVRGEVFLGPGVSEFLMQQALEKQQPKKAGKSFLTERETDVLRLLVDGKTAKEIGQVLFISARTVENYKNSLMKKIGVHKTTDLVKYAITQKLIDTED